MSTYFGEIKELSSRAVYSSDEEDEENLNEPDLKDIQLTFHRNIEFKLSIDFKHVDLIFILNGNTNHVFPQLIGNLSIVEDHAHLKSNIIGRLYYLSPNGLAFQINQNNLMINGYMIGDVFQNDLIFQNLACLRNDVQLVIIDTHDDEDKRLKYLHNHHGSLNLNSELLQVQIESPSIITNLIHSTLFELATILKLSCVLLAFPKFMGYELLNMCYPSNLWKDLFPNHNYLYTEHEIYA
jgi:hypothetical protein